MKLRIRKVISGGQTGADRTALECAQELGLKTGGYCPRGWRTEAGSDVGLKQFGLIETAHDDYPTRTKLNVKSSEATVWFGKISPGFHQTSQAAADEGKEFFRNPTRPAFLQICETYEVVNFAGNRLRKNPDVPLLVRMAFSWLKEALEQERSLDD